MFGKLANYAPGKDMGKQNYKIIIIDDIAEDRATFRNFLQKNSEFEYTFLEAERGKKGIEICLAENPDCVLLDCSLPDSDGLSVIAALNPDALDPALPIILLIGADDESLAGEAIKKGAQDYLVKGEFSYRELQRTVAKTIELRRLQSKHKLANEVLRESEERLRLATEAAEMYSWAINLLDRTIKFTENHARVLGFVLPESFSEAMALVHSADRADAERAFDAEIENTEKFETEYRLIHPQTGAAVWVCTTGVVITDAHGLPVRLVGVTQNITSRKEAEVKLRLGDERMRLATQATAVGIWEWNVITDRVWWNDEMFRIYGIAPTNDGFVDYQNWSKAVLPEDLPEQENILRDTIKNCGSSRREFRFRRKDGEIIYIEAVETARANADGQTEWLLGTNLDITESNKAKMKDAFLAEISHDLLSLPNVGEIMQTVGAKIGTFLNLSICAFVEINEAADEALITHDWHRSDVAGMVGNYRISEFLTSEFQRVSRAGEVFVVRDTAADIRTDTENFAAIDIGSFVSVPIIRDGEWRFLVVMFDTTAHDWRRDEIELISELTTRIWTSLERRRAEESLRESQQVLSLAMQSSRMGAWSRDLITEAVYWSAELEELFGLEAGTFAGDINGFRDYVYVEDKEQIEREIQTALAEHREYIIEFRFHHADGTLRWMEGRGQAVYTADGTPVKMHGIGIDITERKLVEAEREKSLEREQVLRHEAESANRAKDEFLAVLSHELRTPLNAMQGWTQVLQTSDLDKEKVGQAIEVIARNIRLQNALIEDLLDASRIVSGKMRLESETLSLVSTVQSALEAARPAAEKQGVQIESNYDYSADEIFGDKHRLQQIVGNLLTNAVKFTPAGGVVKVKLKRDGGRAKLTVQDSGIGISPELLPYIFERFRQADGSSKRKYGGLGLGLTIVKHLVELHGGNISVRSDGENSGATFTVKLPLAPQIISHADFKPAGQDREGVNKKTNPLAGVRILTVDDDSDALDLICFVLEQYGADVTSVNSAIAALEILQNKEFDLLLSDLGMAGTDGFDLIRRVREMERGSGRTLPAIALTGYVSADDREKVLAAGFEKHLPKPVDTEILPSIILTLLKTK